MVYTEYFINIIKRSTLVRNSVNFNLGVHSLLVRTKRALPESTLIQDAYNAYPPVPSRRLAKSRSSHYPFLQKIYKNLPDRLMFYIPRIEYNLLRRANSMGKVFGLAYTSIWGYMKANYKHLNNDLIAKEDIKSDKYHSMLKNYMPSYYYVYKATQFSKNMRQYSTTNNYHFNNYTVFYLLVLMMFIMIPVYIDIYGLENGLMYGQSQYIKLFFYPSYLDFIYSFIKDHIHAIYYLYISSVSLDLISHILSHYIYIDFIGRYSGINTSLFLFANYFRYPDLVDEYFWTNECSILLVDIYYSIYRAFQYISLFVLFPIKSYLSFVIHHVGEIRNYYFLLILLFFGLIIKHSAGGINQVIKDYVGTRGGFYTSYAITLIIFYLLFNLLSYNVYKEEPEFLFNIIIMGDQLINAYYYFFDLSFYIFDGSMSYIMSRTGYLLIYLLSLV